MATETELSGLGSFLEKWKWLLIGVLSFFMLSSGSQFIWGRERISTQEARTARLEARVDSVERVILPAIDFLITRECMDPTLPQEMYTSQRCYSRLQRHDIQPNR